MSARPPPKDEHELRTRAMMLAGRSLPDLARQLGVSIDGDGVRTKGKLGALVERALGATGGSAAQHDFPHLGIELKTIPIAESGAPRESTYVCTLPWAEVERAEWRTSWVRRKLAHVLWVPIRTDERRIGTPMFWQPTRAQDEVLANDYEELLGTIATQGADAVDARRGRWLQIRPKAANGRVRTAAWSPDDERVATLPRGFYLRARFTGALLRDLTSVP